MSTGLLEEVLGIMSKQEGELILDSLLGKYTLLVGMFYLLDLGDQIGKLEKLFGGAATGED